MPTLDRIYRLADGTSFWGSPLLGSPLATVGPAIPTPAGGRLRPTQTVTIRARWRNDVGVDTQIMDAEDRVWFANEVLEIGRRRWLDVGMSHYTSTVPPSDEPDPDPPPPTDPFTPPASWNFTLDGTPIRSLELATVAVQSAIRFEGTFALPAGEYAGDLDPRNATVYGRIRRTQHVCSFDISGGSTALARLQGGFFDMSFGESGGAIVTAYSEFAGSNFALTADVSLAAGDVIDLANADEDAMVT